MASSLGVERWCAKTAFVDASDRRGSDASPVVTPPQEAHGDDASMAERVRAAPRIPAPQQILEPEQTTVVSFTDDDEAPTPAQSPEQSYDALETNEAAQDAAQS